MAAKTEQEALRFSKSTRFGSLIAFISILSIGLIEVFKRVEYLQIRLAWSVGLILAFGVVLLVLRFELYLRKSTPEEVLNFHRNPHYWGVVLMATGCIVYVFCPPYMPERPLVVARTPPPVVAEPEIIEFPNLKVSAVVVNGTRSSATINGSVVWLGEDVNGVTLVDVSESSVIVELKGIHKEIPCFGAKLETKGPEIVAAGAL
jgi:hypothetical protein